MRRPAAYPGRVTKPQIPPPAVEKSDEQWRAELSPAEYQVLRKAGTERPWTGEYVENKRTGVYRCRACGSELFRSDTKFDSHCGWPSFWSPLAGERVILREDRGLGMTRVEVLCAQLPLPPRARLLRRGLRHADRRPLLHQLDLPDLRGREVVTSPASSR